MQWWMLTFIVGVFGQECNIVEWKHTASFQMIQIGMGERVQSYLLRNYAKYDFPPGEETVTVQDLTSEVTLHVRSAMRVLHFKGLDKLRAAPIQSLPGGRLQIQVVQKDPLDQLEFDLSITFYIENPVRLTPQVQSNMNKVHQATIEAMGPLGRFRSPRRLEANRQINLNIRVVLRNPKNKQWMQARVLAPLMTCPWNDQINCQWNSWQQFWTTWKSHGMLRAHYLRRIKTIEVETLKLNPIEVDAQVVGNTHNALDRIQRDVVQKYLDSITKPGPAKEKFLADLMESNRIAINQDIHDNLVKTGILNAFGC